MKHIKIEIPKGYVIDEGKSTFEKIVFKKKNALPKSWEEYVNSADYVKDIFSIHTFEALDKLLVLRDKYRNGWKPDWKSNSYKYFIGVDRNIFKGYTAVYTNRIFSFQSMEIRDLFFKNFKDLLEKVKPLFL